MTPVQRLRDRLIWCGLVALLWGHWSLFAAHVRRDVSWFHAAHYDQTESLHGAYTTYEAARREGTLPALAEALRKAPPTSTILHLMPLPIFALKGPSRLAALAVNWLAFAALQLALVAGARRLGGWPAAALALALVWAAAAPFYWAGGLDDFRADFAALCFYGAFMAAVVWSDVFRRHGLAFAAGAAAAATLLARSITAVYLGGVLLAFGALALVRLWRAREPAAREDDRRTLGGLVRCAAVVALVGLPMLAMRAERLWSYYVVGHVTSGEKFVRAEGVGVRTLLDNLAYYPRSVLADHAGPFLLALAALALLALRLGRRAEPGARGDARVRRDRYVFAALCAVVPVVVLTLDLAKSPVVAGIAVPALLWLVVLSAAELGERAPPRLAAVVGVIALAVAGAWHVRRLLRPPQQFVWPVEIRQEVLRLHDAIVSVSRARGWRAPYLLGDRQRDYLPAVRVSAYERQHVLLDVQQPLGNGVLGLTDDLVRRALASSHFLLVTEPDPREVLSLPFDRTLRDWHRRLRDHGDRELELVGTYHVPEEVRLYARPPGREIAHSP